MTVENPYDVSENDHSSEPASVGELFAQLSAEFSTLVRDEIRLAQLEMTSKGKRLGAGAGLFGGAGVLAWFGVGSLVAAAILGIATGLAAWLSALIVGAALLVVAGIGALVGRKEVSRAIPPVPDEALSAVKADVTTVKEAAHR